MGPMELRLSCEAIVRLSCVTPIPRLPNDTPTSLLPDGMVILCLSCDAAILRLVQAPVVRDFCPPPPRSFSYSPAALLPAWAQLGRALPSMACLLSQGGPWA